MRRECLPSAWRCAAGIALEGTASSDLCLLLLLLLAVCWCHSWCCQPFQQAAEDTSTPCEASRQLGMARASSCAGCCCHCARFCSTTQAAGKVMCMLAADVYLDSRLAVLWEQAVLVKDVQHTTTVLCAAKQPSIPLCGRDFTCKKCWGCVAWRLPCMCRIQRLQTS
jgi:hypothetical protein